MAKYSTQHEVLDGVHYDEQNEVWIYKGKKYDARSAFHNGIIGPGATMRRIVREALHENAHAR